MTRKIHAHDTAIPPPGRIHTNTHTTHTPTLTCTASCCSTKNAFNAPSVPNRAGGRSNAAAASPLALGEGEAAKPGGGEGDDLSRRCRRGFPPALGGGGGSTAWAAASRMRAAASRCRRREAGSLMPAGRSGGCVRVWFGKVVSSFSGNVV